MPEPTRYDLEFMARMLGVGEIPPGVPVEVIERAVAAGMRDPIANARAQHRLAALAAQLPPH